MSGMQSRRGEGDMRAPTHAHTRTRHFQHLPHSILPRSHPPITHTLACGEGAPDSKGQGGVLAPRAGDVPLARHREPAPTAPPPPPPHTRIPPPDCTRTHTLSNTHAPRAQTRCHVCHAGKSFKCEVALDMAAIGWQDAHTTERRLAFRATHPSHPRRPATCFCSMAPVSQQPA